MVMAPFIRYTLCDFNFLKLSNQEEKKSYRTLVQKPESLNHKKAMNTFCINLMRADNFKNDIALWKL